MRLITWFLFPNFVAVWCCVHRKSSIIEIDSLELKLDGLEVDSLELFTSSIVHSPWIALGGGGQSTRLGQTNKKQVRSLALPASHSFVEKGRPTERPTTGNWRRGRKRETWHRNVITHRRLVFVFYFSFFSVGVFTRERTRDAAIQFRRCRPLNQKWKWRRVAFSWPATAAVTRLRNTSAAERTSSTVRFHTMVRHRATHFAHGTLWESTRKSSRRHSRVSSSSFFCLFITSHLTVKKKNSPRRF